MIRIVTLAVVMVSVVLGMQATPTFAHGKHNKDKHDHGSHGNNKPPVIDPGIGNGKPPMIVDPLRPKRDVVVRDHRRPRPNVRDHRDTSTAPGGTVVTDTPVVRDHRRPGPVVRDHRDSPIVRDHRTPKGGSIFDPFADKRRPGKVAPKSPVIPIDPGRGDGKVGPWIPIDPGRGDGKVIVRDHRDVVVRDHRTPRPSVLRPSVRDHRDTSNNPGGTSVTSTPVVRDHRGSGPVVRDHRNARPVVRDHR